MKIEHGSFTPLVMSAAGGMGQEWKKILRSAEMINSKRGTDYNITVAWLRKTITFSLIKTIGICLRGSRSIVCSDSLEQSLSGDAYVSDFFSNVWYHILHYTTIASYKL